jgi:essential nuclear protein 1
MPKETAGRKVATAQLRHAPLDRQISVSEKRAEGRLREGQRIENGDDQDGQTVCAEYIDVKTSRKIMQQAQQQREELTAFAAVAPCPRAALGVDLLRGSAEIAMAEEADEDAAVAAAAAAAAADREDEEDGDFAADFDEMHESTKDGYLDIAEIESALSISERTVMASFFGSATERRTINDIILEKIREKEEEAQARVEREAAGELHHCAAPVLPEKVVAVYTQIGMMLRHYTSGKLPKAFKIIPSLTNWEEVLWLTKPDAWSPHTVYAATRIFASNLNERMAQRFYNLILLGRVRDDIEKNGRLNFHLFSALRKAVYKPAAFFKGILLPLAAEGAGCTLKEATVVAAVMSRVSIPANHSAVALLKLAQLPYSGPTSLFVRVLLNKKYALPHSVLDTLVEHFMSFSTVRRELPILWHQSLLVFAQRYKHDIEVAQKNRIKDLLKVQFHYQITPEIRRELFAGRSRGEIEVQDEDAC